VQYEENEPKSENEKSSGVPNPNRTIRLTEPNRTSRPTEPNQTRTWIFRFDSHLYTSCINRRSPIQVLTGLGVA